MSDYGNTGENSTLSRLSAMGACVLSAAGLRPTFTISTAGAEMQKIGVSVLITSNAFVENITPLDISDEY